MNTTRLDLTGLTPDAQQERLIGAFQELADGTTLEVMGDAPLSQGLRALQERHWGTFDWHPLENGPTRWRVGLQRLPGKKRGIGDFLGMDHERCDTLFAALENAAQSGELETAQELFGVFETGMVHHFDMEEKRFFPAFEQATGMTQGPTMVMRMEHRQMLGVIGQMRQAIQQGDLSGITRGGSTLMVLMRQHNIKEEQMLYPMGDMHLGEVQPLLREMQTV
ncbi:MAG: hemerythrin domain-containing protein [Magnetococcales bacterium]|nr:hemerythrin domain-containing protein [Magnetococcales bacterium]